jgi:hypothetical protein
MTKVLLAFLTAMAAAGCIGAPDHGDGSDGDAGLDSGSGGGGPVHYTPPTPPCAAFACGGTAPGVAPRPYTPTCVADTACSTLNGTSCGNGLACNTGECCSIVAVCRNLFGPPVPCPDRCTDAKGDAVPCPICQPDSGCICYVNQQVVECPQETSVNP